MTSLTAKVLKINLYNQTYDFHDIERKIYFHNHFHTFLSILKNSLATYNLPFIHLHTLDRQFEFQRVYSSPLKQKEKKR